MRFFFLFSLMILNFSAIAHRGDYLSIEQVKISNTENGKTTYAFKIENITNTSYEGVQIEFIKNGKSIQTHFYNLISGSEKFKADHFTFNQEDINPEKDLIQIEITKLFNETNDWGGWDSPNILKQTNTVASEFYVDAPWRMKKTDESGNDLPIPLHFFLHDADQIIAYTLNVDYVNIKIKSASSPTFGSILTYNTIPTSTFNSMFSCLSPDNPGLGIKEFDITALSPTVTNTIDFDGEYSFPDDFVSVPDAYWYFNFDIPASDLVGLDDVIDIEVTINYANFFITTDDVIRMRVFRSNNDIPTQANYYRGDTHLHSMYTQNDAEMGLPLSATKEAAKKIGLDWITTTDHTSDFDNYGTANVNTNWTELQHEVVALNTADNSLIYIAGQEVAATNSENKLVHMLAYPSYNTPTTFPFLGDGFGDLTSTTISIDNVVSQLTAVDGFSYCSHPFASNDILPTLPVNGGIWNLGHGGFPLNTNLFPGIGGVIVCNNITFPSDILDTDPNKHIKDAIKGSQIWNVRPNVEVSGIFGSDSDPWDVTNSGWPMTQVDTSLFTFHQKRLKQGQEVVNHINKVGLAAKNENNSIQNWKMYYSAGSDAHGSFNYSNTDNFAGTGSINNNAVGKLNTLAYCPNGMGTNGSEVLKAMYNGHISMSDGPVITMGISLDGDNTSNEVLMGEDSVLDLASKANIFVNFNYTTTPEFGEFEKFTFIVGTSTGELRKELTLASSSGNNIESYNLLDLLDSVFGIRNTPNNQYLYIRAEIETFVDYTSMTNEHRTTYDYFHSYTNPIWISWDQYTGVEEQNNELIVFPNPSTNQLVIKTDNPSEFLTYSLYNNLGQLITEKEIKNNFEFIDISYLSKGFYNLVIYKENNAPIVKKIIKQ